MRVTESVIAKAILTNEEAKVIRAFYGLESAKEQKNGYWALVKKPLTSFCVQQKKRFV